MAFEQREIPPFPFALEPLDPSRCAHRRKQWVARAELPGFAVLWCLNCNNVIARQDPLADGTGVQIEERSF